MRVVSHKTLKDFYELPGHNDAKVPLEYWYHVTECAEWKNYADMKSDFGSVDSVGNQHYVFNIDGGHHRLVVVAKSFNHTILVRWIGTHAEYDKIKDVTIL